MTAPVSRTGVTAQEVEAPSEDLVADAQQYIGDRAAVWEVPFNDGPGNVVSLSDAAHVAARWHLARAAAAPDSGLELFSRLYDWLGRYSSEPGGDEWDHEHLRDAVTLLLRDIPLALLAEQPGGGR